MSSQSEAQKAISMFNGQNLDDRQMAVSMARPREERGGGGGGGFRQNRSSGNSNKRRY
jgi:RNA recognition motif-containing protein